MDRYDAYDPFAELYNRRWSGFALRVIPILDRLVLDGLPPGATVVDLCCGTGQLMGGLADRGLDLIGVDGSAAMIDHARVNAPGATLIVDDARSFRIDRPADAVVSTFDSLNHVMTAAGLAQVFLRVGEALRPGGVFVFDVNNHEGYSTRWGGSFVEVDDDEVVAVRSTFDETSGDATIRVTHLTDTAPGSEAGEATWRRSDLRFTQHCHPDDEIRASLTAAGFVDIEHWEARELDPVDMGEGRSFYRAIRPK